MDIEVVKMEKGGIYLKTKNGVWKRFDTVFKDFLDEYIIKLKPKRFRVDGEYVWASTPMGKNQDECWIYAGLSPKDREESLIFEVVETHFDENGIVMDKERIAQIAQVIRQNKDYRKMIKTIFIQGGDKI
jgi:hypothetical protein